MWGIPPPLLNVFSAVVVTLNIFLVFFCPKISDSRCGMCLVLAPLLERGAGWVPGDTGGCHSSFPDQDRASGQSVFFELENKIRIPGGGSDLQSRGSE